MKTKKMFFLYALAIFTASLAVVRYATDVESPVIRLIWGIAIVLLLFALIFFSRTVRNKTP
jgi:hypothetical protein